MEFPENLNSVPSTCLQRWGTTSSQLMPPCIPSQAPRYTVCPFPVNEKLNDKICLWDGDMTLLKVDGIIAGTNEYAPPEKSFTDRVFQKNSSKSETDEEVFHVGNVKVIKEPSISAEYLIYTLGPRFIPKYRTACDHALYTTYRNVFDRARQLRLKSVGIGVVHSSKKYYPSQYGAHIALRTLRRFLEHYPDDFELLVLIVDQHYHGVYERLLPLYFPRGPLEEQAACWKLPFPIGGPWGQPIISPEEIRIIENPHNFLIDQEPLEELDLETIDELANEEDGKEKEAVAPVQGERSDVERETVVRQRDPVYHIIMKKIEESGKYDKMLKRAKSEDLSEISNLGCLYQNGTDRLGRPVIVFIGKWLKFPDTDLNKFVLFMISFLDQLVNHDYVMIYFHTKTTQANRPGLKWFTSIYNLLPPKYKKNLKAVYIVHPSFWTKSLTWWIAKFLAPGIRNKIHIITGIEYLYSIIVPSQLEIPAFITEYDISINGVRYYKPDQPIPEERIDFNAAPSVFGFRSSMSDSFARDSDDPPEWEPFVTASEHAASSSELDPLTSKLKALCLSRSPSTSAITSSFPESSNSQTEPTPSTSGLASSLSEPRLSEAGQVEDSTTSTWELRRTKSGYRFEKLGPRSSNDNDDKWKLLVNPLTYEIDAGMIPPDAFASISQPKTDPVQVRVDPTTLQCETKVLDIKPGSLTAQPKTDKWKLQLDPSALQFKTKVMEHRLGISQPKSAGRRVTLDTSTLQTKSNVWNVQLNPLAFDNMPYEWESEPGSSTSKPRAQVLKVVDPSTSKTDTIKIQPQPGPSTSQPKLQVDPSAPKVASATSPLEPVAQDLQPVPITSQPKPDPWKVALGEAKSQSEAVKVEPEKSEPLPGPSTSKPETESSTLKSPESSSQSKSLKPKKETTSQGTQTEKHLYRRKRSPFKFKFTEL